MCMICAEYEKGKLTKEEAVRNLGEILSSAESVDKLTDAEFDHLMDLEDQFLDESTK